MSTYLVLSDVHGNLEALEAVLAHAPSYDGTLVLGDLVDYGPNPNEVVDQVRRLPNLTVIAGNHDLGVLSRVDISDFNLYAQQSLLWTRQQLRPDVTEYLEALPYLQPMPGVLLAHGSPRDPVWEYLESGDQGPQNFAAFDQHLALVGHTHKPRIFTNRPSTSSSEVTVPVSDQAVSIDGERMIINPGGVGQPRDGNPLAAFGIYQPDEARFTFYRVPYEIETTQQKMRQARLPEPLVQRLAFGL